MGQNKDTIKIMYNGVAYMKFHAKDLIDAVSKYNDTIELEVIGRPNLNEWNGYVTPQIFIDDYELKDARLSILEF
jgi:hypothetical protein